MRHVVLVRHAAVDHEQRFGPEVFAHLQVFVVAQAVGRAVAPQVPMPRPLGDVADGLLPAESVRQLVTLHVAAAGKPHERRLRSGQHLRQVGPQAVGPALNVSLGNSDTMSSQTVPGAVVAMTRRAGRFGAAGGQRALEFLPVRRQSLKLVFCHHSRRRWFRCWTASGPGNPSPLRAYSVSSYCAAFRTAMPRNPSLATPTRWPPAVGHLQPQRVRIAGVQRAAAYPAPFGPRRLRR